MTGLGRIDISPKATIGYFPSPGFGGELYFEARSERSFISIGAHTFINNGIRVIAERSEIVIGEACLVGMDVLIVDSDFHDLDPSKRVTGVPKFGSVKIGDNVFVGARATILKGVTIGRDSVVGACAVVSRDVPAGAIVVGNPARVVGNVYDGPVEPPVFFDTRADVQSKKVGSGTKIWQFCVVLEGAQIGKNVNINSHCFVENSVVIGDNVTVKCGCYLWDGLVIEDDVFIGPNVTFSNDLFPRSKNFKPPVSTIIKKGASLGAASTIRAGVTVGSYSLVGAGALVLTDVPSYAVVYGVPATFKYWICSCGTKLTEHLVCANCGSQYSLQKGELITIPKK